MSASYNPLQTEDQQIEADAAYARRLQAEERRSATTQSPLHDVSEISRNHAAAPQFPKIPSPAKLVEGLSREQTAGAVFAAQLRGAALGRVAANASAANTPTFNQALEDAARRPKYLSG